MEQLLGPGFTDSGPLGYADAVRGVAIGGRCAGVMFSNGDAAARRLDWVWGARTAGSSRGQAS